MSAKHRSRRLARFLGIRVGALLVRSSRAFVRPGFIHGEREETALADYKAVIYTFWHGRFWLVAAQTRRRGVGVLVSRSADGEVIAQIAERLGHDPIRGSTSRGAREGLRRLEQRLGENRSVAITPDGPRGPFQKAQAGAIFLAAHSGKPIIPVGVASRPAWAVRSWDAFQIPKPGARGAIVFGEPLVVPREHDQEALRSELQDSLIRLQEEAEREVTR